MTCEAVSENQRGELVLTDTAHQLTKGGGKPGQGYPMVLLGPSSPCSPGSEASTSDSNEPDGDASDNANSTPGGEASSSDGGRESQDGQTCEVWAIEAVGRKMSGGPEVGQGIRNDGTMYTLDRASKHAVALTSSAAGSPAKTSPSPGSVPASRGNGRASSSSSRGSSGLFDLDGSSLRMYPDSFPRTVAAISPSFSRRWPTSGMAWPGACWTLDTSESPSDAVEWSLSDILEPSVPSRFSLSSKAAAGILRRAERRGKTLPEHLEHALAAVAERRTSTDTGPTSPSTTTSRTSRTEP